MLWTRHGRLIYLPPLIIDTQLWLRDIHIYRLVNRWNQSTSSHWFGVDNPSKEIEKFISWWFKKRVKSVYQRITTVRIAPHAMKAQINLNPYCFIFSHHTSDVCAAYHQCVISVDNDLYRRVGIQWKKCGLSIYQLKVVVFWDKRTLVQ